MTCRHFFLSGLFVQDRLRFSVVGRVQLKQGKKSSKDSRICCQRITSWFI